MTEAQAQLDALRQRIDAVDDRLHDLLIERAALIEAVASVKRSGEVPPFRPGREAQILRRLVARHRGRFPRRSLMRIWHEIMGAGVAMQTELTVALAPDCAALARDQFGGEAPMLEFPSASAVVNAVREGSATVGVLPLVKPSERWWLDLAAMPASSRPRVVARLPLGLYRGPSPVEDALVIARMTPEASGEDDTVYAVFSRQPLAIARITDALTAAGFDCAPLAETAHAALVAVKAMLPSDDSRVGRVVGPLGSDCDWLGAYARPFPEDALDGALR